MINDFWLIYTDCDCKYWSLISRSTPYRLYMVLMRKDIFQKEDVLKFKAVIQDTPKQKHTSNLDTPYQN